MRSLILILLCALIWGCTTERKVTKYLNNNPSFASGWCAEKYPVKDSILPPVIKYVPAANIDYSKVIDSINRSYSSLRKYADSMAKVAMADDTDCGKLYAPIIRDLSNKVSSQASVINKLRDDYKACIPDTAFVFKTVLRENTAKTASLQEKLNKLSTTNDTNIKWKKFFMWWSIAATALIGAFIVYKLIKR